MLPVVRDLYLEAVFNQLLEQAVLVADAIAVERYVLRSRAVKEAGGKPSKAAVAERRVR